MSELEAQYVKHGYWVNHAHGPVIGQVGYPWCGSISSHDRILSPTI